MERKYHWYLVSFAHERGFSSATMGLISKNVSEKDISEARKASGAGYSAAPLSVSYLGKMTEEEANHK